jgi:hypothetical protein
VLASAPVHRRAPVLLALLLVSPAAAAAPKPLRASAPEVPKRWAVDATFSHAQFDGASVTAGVRARVRDDPFQFELSWDQDLTDRAQPDFRWLALGGGGLVREPASRWTVYGGFLFGAYGVEYRDSNTGAARSGYGPAVGVRATLARSLPALRFRSFEPRLGLSATVVFAGTRHHDDVTRRISWGGPAALLSLSVGSETIASAPAVVPGR